MDGFLTFDLLFYRHDPVAYCLTVLGLLASLLEGVRHWRSWCMGLGIGCVGLVASPIVTVLALGLMMEGDARTCPLWWRVPALLLFGLIPYQVWGLSVVLPLLLWPWFDDGSEAGGPSNPALAIPESAGAAIRVAVLASLLIWHDAGSMPLPAVLVAVGLAVVFLGQAIGRPGRGQRLGGVGRAELVRPCLLMALGLASGREGLDMAAGNALLAGLLDLSVQYARALLSVRCPYGPCLSAPFPPMPGLIVLWLGVHAALGLAVGAQGWSVLSLLCVVFLGGLSVLECGALLAFFQDRSRGLDVSAVRWFLGLLFVLDGGIGLAQNMVLETVPATRDTGLGARVLEAGVIAGGDGAFLRLGLLAGLLGLILWVSVARTGGGTVLAERSDCLPDPVQRSLFRLTVDQLPWMSRRYLVRIRVFLRDVSMFRVVGKEIVHTLARPFAEGNGALGWWLAVLAVFLAVLGIAAS